MIFIGFSSSAIKAQAVDECINSVANWSVAKIQNKKKPKYWIDSKFTKTEKVFIEKALQLAIDRIQEKSVWQTVKNSYRYANPKSTTILNSGFCNNLNVKRNLLFHQLYTLTSTNAKNAKKEFPKIYIYHSNTPPKRGEYGWVGYAYYNKVSVYWDYQTQDWERNGDFQLYLNQYFLRKTGIYKSENYWAGTIAHEMLHNLGHQHPKSSDSRYEEFQINILANAIRNFDFEATAGDIIDYPIHTCRSESSGEATASDIE